MRVVVSLTTLPGRAILLQRTIRSIREQSRPPDAIYLWLPSEHFGDRHEDQLFTDVHLGSGPDLGPAMKILPVLAQETAPETCIITIDDDIEYPKDMIARLLSATQLLPHHALGFTGWNRIGGVAELEVLHLNEDSPRAAMFQPVQVLEGYRGVLYRRSFFESSIYERLTALPAFRFHDDILISGYLASKGVPRSVCWYSAQIPPPGSHWKLNGDDIGLHTRSSWLTEAWEAWDYWNRHFPGVFQPTELRTPDERLQLGAGLHPRPGFLHHDAAKTANMAFTHDLHQLPWPWQDDSFAELLALDLFAEEKAPAQEWLGECWRILRPGGQLMLQVPLRSEAGEINSLQNPNYWDERANQLWRRAWHREGDLYVGTFCKIH